MYERSGENAITREQGFSELAEDIGDGPHHPDRFWHGLTRFMNGLVQVQAGPTQLGVLDRVCDGPNATARWKTLPSMIASRSQGG